MTPKPSTLKKVFILPYFGEWPPWFGYFLKSCQKNPGFDWLLISEQPPTQKLPENVRFKPCSFRQLRKDVSIKLGFEIALEHPYKLTDFKPAYGIIFEDFIKSYDIWGYTDIDIIYGKLADFLPDELIAEFDVISPGTELIPGHFCLFRNTDKVNRLFELSSNWKQVFSDPRSYCFDEFLYVKGFETSTESVFDFIKTQVGKHVALKKSIRKVTGRKLIRKITRNSIKKPMNDFNSVINHCESIRPLRVYKKTLYQDEIMHLIDNKKQIELTWEKGVLTEHGRNLLYFHFQLSKYKNRLTFSEYEEEPGNFQLNIDLSEWKSW